MTTPAEDQHLDKHNQIKEIGLEHLRDGRLEEARLFLETVAHHAPELTDVHHHLGEVHFRQRRIGPALASYERALRLGHDPDLALQERWMCRMMLGDFAGAWRESDGLEARRREKEQGGVGQATERPMVWDGTPLAGKRVMVRCYHGLGDTIQFIRYLPKLRQICRRVTVEAQPRLVPLLTPLVGTSGGMDELITWEQPPAEPGFDVEIEVMEFPYAFRTTLETLPANIPYLFIDPRLEQAALGWIASERRLKIGLAWASSSWHGARSVPLRLFAPLAALPDVALFSLLLPPEADQLKDFPELGIVDLREHLDGVAETAAIIQQLDLVIAVDTMAAHLAGALGKPVWTLLLHGADWRWMVEREDSPWYPTMRLFRQPTPGDWTTPLERIAQALVGQFP